MSIKFASVKKIYISPHPQIAIFFFFLEIMVIEEAAVRTSIMVDLPIVHFRNPWHNSFCQNIIYTVL